MLDFYVSFLPQIRSLLRTDMFSCKQQMLAIRPEAVPSLRPSTVLYISQAVKSGDVGLKGRTDFMADKPEKGKVCRKVNCYVYYAVGLGIDWNLDIDYHLYKLIAQSINHHK